MHSIRRLPLALIAIATAVAAQPVPQRAPQYPPAGGGATLASFQAKLKAHLARLDTNHDGRVSLAEYQAGMSGKGRGGDPARKFSKMDANRDGFVDQGEADAFAARRFAKHDLNGDGVLTADERGARQGHASPQR